MKGVYQDVRARRTVRDLRNNYALAKNGVMSPAGTGLGGHAVTGFGEAGGPGRRSSTMQAPPSIAGVRCGNTVPTEHGYVSDVGARRVSVDPWRRRGHYGPHLAHTGAVWER